MLQCLMGDQLWCVAVGARVILLGLLLVGWGMGVGDGNAFRRVFVFTGKIARGKPKSSTASLNYGDNLTKCFQLSFREDLPVGFSGGEVNAIESLTFDSGGKAQAIRSNRYWTASCSNTGRLVHDLWLSSLFVKVFFFVNVSY